MEEKNISPCIAPAAVNQLLVPLPPQLELSYIKELINCMGLDGKVEVREAVGKEGKGVFSMMTFKRGEIVWEEGPLIAMQHQSSKAPSCSNCHAYLGSIEHQIGSKLHHIREDSLEALEEEEGEEREEMTAASNRLDLIKTAGVTEADISALISGQRRLPMSDRFPLAPAIACSCEQDMYCSISCRDDFNRMHHRILCLPTQPTGGRGKRRRVGSSQAPKAVGVDLEALREFHELATETNEIFILASRVLVLTALRAEELFAAGASHVSKPAHSSLATKPTIHAAHEAVSNLLSRGELTVSTAFEALRCAWLPFHVGWKKVWHEAVACPQDVEDEEAFRSQLKDLASSASTALRAALPEMSLKYPELFADDVFSSVVAMFELNNLSISPPSPVEDYFLAVEDSNDEAAKAETKPFLDALDKAYDERVEGTGFFALQSLVNHDCAPTTIPEWVFPGPGVSRALASMACLKDIAPGDEISISYIDEGLEKDERQEKLRDYGFACKCNLCSV